MISASIFSTGFAFIFNRTSGVIRISLTLPSGRVIGVCLVAWSFAFSIALSNSDVKRDPSCMTLCYILLYQCYIRFRRPLLLQDLFPIFDETTLNISQYLK